MAREQSGKAAGFQASTTPSMSMEKLERRVAELEGMVASTKAPTFASGGFRGTTRQTGGRIFKGVCYSCGERGHRRSECVKRVAPYQSANQAAAGKLIDQDNNTIAFPAIVSVRSWADVVRQEIQSAGYGVESDSIIFQKQRSRFCCLHSRNSCSERTTATFSRTREVRAVVCRQRCL